MAGRGFWCLSAGVWKFVRRWNGFWSMPISVGAWATQVTGRFSMNIGLRIRPVNMCRSFWVSDRLAALRPCHSGFAECCDTGPCMRPPLLKCKREWNAFSAFSENSSRSASLAASRRIALVISVASSAGTIIPAFASRTTSAIPPTSGTIAGTPVRKPVKAIWAPPPTSTT